MKIFVAGATGVIGTELVPMLVASGHDVTGICRSRPGKQQVEAAGARSVEADLFDPGSLNSVLVGSEVVINLATSIPPLSRMGDSSAWRLNDRLRTEGAANLAEVAANNSAAIFIQPSVTFLYADGGDRWLDESSPVDPPPMLRSALDAEASATPGAASWSASSPVKTRERSQRWSWSTAVTPTTTPLSVSSPVHHSLRK